MRHLHDVRVQEAGDDVLQLLGSRAVVVLCLGQVDDIDRAIIPGVGQQQYLEVVALHILEGAGLRDVHAAVGFQVNQQTTPLSP